MSAASLVWLEWSIFITNVPREWLTLWKSECQIDRIAGRIRDRVLCEIYAKLIGSVVFQYISFPLRWTDRELSPVKAIQTFRRFAVALANTLQNADQLDALLSKLFDIWRHCGLKDKHHIQLTTCQRIFLAGQILA